MMNSDALHSLACEAGALLKHQGKMLAVAESCTGGWLAETITSVAGSSAWFERGFITYSNQAKQDMLGVSLAVLTQFGAVSKQVAVAMAEGTLTHSQAQYAIALTGIAGPEGGTIDKPCGTVWIAWACIGKVAQAICYQFEGDRQAVRMQAVCRALEACMDNFRE